MRKEIKDLGVEYAKALLDEKEDEANEIDGMRRELIKKTEKIKKLYTELFGIEYNSSH